MFLFLYEVTQCVLAALILNSFIGFLEKKYKSFTAIEQPAATLVQPDIKDKKKFETKPGQLQESADAVNRLDRKASSSSPSEVVKPDTIPA